MLNDAQSSLAQILDADTLHDECKEDDIKNDLSDGPLGEG